MPDTFTTTYMFICCLHQFHYFVVSISTHLYEEEGFVSFKANVKLCIHVFYVNCVLMKGTLLHDSFILHTAGRA